MNNEQQATNADIDVSNFSRHLNGRNAPIWWGIIGLILIELSVVSAFTVTYLYLYMQHPQWPPNDIELPPLLIPTWSMILMLLSCVTMYLAGKSVEKSQPKGFVIYTFASVFMALLVLWIRWGQFDNFSMSWNEHVYGSLLWTISGFHFIHIVSAAIGTAAIGFFGVAGFYTKQRQIGVVVDTMYWNFVALAWLPFYFVLYYFPRF
ncbi:cytochrome c oxidase subunit 3 [Catenovulum adriaticum]|uniref:cytochrome-c oxidase n=1 Tax=Catenovulum adriaticum TaxID=2984846 RepID=A0ABY7AQ46_9ALTE|nr:cytochrome c oxidase subunit 3 [Catenovulum sp. TS8]WAJ71669.1 cytochrome c oxidase subunit 3 [Catenovulum sp. TS8]